VYRLLLSPNLLFHIVVAQKKRKEIFSQTWIRHKLAPKITTLKGTAFNTPVCNQLFLESLKMSQKAEQAISPKDTWKQVDQGTASPQDIQRIYDSIWNDRKPVAGAVLTDAERTQYGRQNSAGLPVKNSDASHGQESPKTAACAEKSLPDVTINIDALREKGLRTNELPNSNACSNNLPERAAQHAIRSINDRNPRAEQHPPQIAFPSVNSSFARLAANNYYHGDQGVRGDEPLNRHGYRPLELITDRHDRRPVLRADAAPVRFEPNLPVVTDLTKARFETNWPVGAKAGEVIQHQSDKDKLEDRTQKVSYPDGSSRVVLRDEHGKISTVINPDGSRLERKPGKPGEAPFWQAYGRYDTPITADSFRGSVEMTEDGTFRMTKTYPVPQIYEQKPNGDYRKAYKGGAAEQWTVATQTDTMLYPTDKTDKTGKTFKAREIKFAPDDNGILKPTAVTDR
jgi:hypothetical protein